MAILNDILSSMKGYSNYDNQESWRRGFQPLYSLLCMLMD